jgi:hypothetical protein
VAVSIIYAPQDRPSSQDADAADRDRGALSPSAHNEARARPQDLPYLLRGMKITRQPRQRLHLSTRKKCSDNRDHLTKKAPGRRTRSSNAERDDRVDDGSRGCRRTQSKPAFKATKRRFARRWRVRGAPSGILGHTTGPDDRMLALWLQPRTAHTRIGACATCVRIYVTGTLGPLSGILSSQISRHQE